MPPRKDEKDAARRIELVMICHMLTGAITGLGDDRRLFHAVDPLICRLDDDELVEAVAELKETRRELTDEAEGN